MFIRITYLYMGAQTRAQTRVHVQKRLSTDRCMYIPHLDVCEQLVGHNYVNHSNVGHSYLGCNGVDLAGRRVATLAHL